MGIRLQRRARIHCTLVSVPPMPKGTHGRPTPSSDSAHCKEMVHSPPRESGIVNSAMEQPHRIRWTGIVTFAVALLLTACGALPSQVDRPPSAARKAADSTLGRIAADSTPDAAQTGFRLMPMGSYSLDARIQLARRAEDTLDLQYYLVRNDRSGRLLM